MIKEIVEEFKSNRISPKEFSGKMFEAYEILLEYKDLLKSSIVEKIEITEENVVINIRKNSEVIRMILYPLDSAAVPVTIMSFGEYETEELDMVLRLIRMLNKDCTVFDVGANLGWYTLNIIKDMPSRKVYSFEPIEETYLKLKENLHINNIESKDAFNFGFYTENNVLEFFYDITASGASSIADLRELDTTKKVNCDFKRLDDFVVENNIESLDFIKCDVEGSELFVYKGGIESIKKFKPIIFSEMLRKWSAKFEYHPNDIIDLLEGIGYKCFVIEDDRLKAFGRVDEETLETNYFFLHKDKHSQIITEISPF